VLYDIAEYPLVTERRRQGRCAPTNARSRIFDKSPFAYC